MEPLKQEQMSLSSTELLELVAKHFGVDAKTHQLLPRYRFASGSFGPSGDMHPGIVMAMHTLDLAPIKPPRKRATKKVSKY